MSEAAASNPATLPEVHDPEQNDDIAQVSLIVRILGLRSLSRLEILNGPQDKIYLRPPFGFQPLECSVS